MSIRATIKATCDLARPLTVTPLRHALVSGDDRGDLFELTILQNGEPADITGAGVMGYFIRQADGATVTMNGMANGNKAALILPASCYAEAGRFTLTVKIAQHNERHTVYVAEGAVLRSSTDTMVDPGHVIPSLEELLAQVARIESTIQAAETATGQVTNAVQQATSAVQKANGVIDATEATRASATSAAQAANQAAEAIDGLTVEASDGEAVGATVTNVDGHKHIAFTLRAGRDGKDGRDGAKGEPGLPNIVKGQAYDSLEALQQGVPSPAEGDQYNVGEALPYHVYRWTGTEWEDQGVTQGPKGDPGAPGKDGAKGADGATFTPSVSPEGMLSWTNDQELPNPETVNIRGPKGEDGIPGINGENGEPGAPGKDGVTPHIDEESGNWYIGDRDTGVHAQGPEGKPGTTAGVPYSDEEPKPLGAATAGVSEEVSRADHVHPIPDVGGRNYLPNTKTMDGYRRNQHISILKENDGDSYMASWETMESLEWRLLFTPSIKYSLVRNKYITLSASIKSDDDVSEKIYFSIMPYKKGETTRHQYADLISHPFPKPTKKWTRFSVTIFIEDNMFTWSETSDKIDLDDTCDFAAAIFSHGVNSFQIKEIKLEIGKVPTDWSPAPEDLVPATRTINGKPLDKDITLQGADIPGAIVGYPLDNGTSYAEVNFTPTAKDGTRSLERFSLSVELPDCKRLHTFVQKKGEGSETGLTHYYYTNWNKPTPSDIGAVASVWGVKADGSGNAKPQIGGRNLFQCSKTLEGWTIGNDDGSISDGVATIIENKEFQDSNKEHYFRVGDYRKQKMVASFDVQSDNLDLLSPSLVISFFHENSRNARFAWKTISSAKIQKTGEWTRIYVFFRISDFESQLGYVGEETPLEDSDVFVVAYRTITGDQPFSGNFRLPKLEIGDVPTAWTPALEDVLPTISDVDLEAGSSNLESGRIYLVYE